MNFKKTIIYILLSIVALIFIYNYILPYFILQSYDANSMGMSMGMHMKEGFSNNIQYNYTSFGNIIFLAVVVLVAFLLLDKILFTFKSNRCKKCGLIIESDHWKVCPRCGNHLHQRKEE